MASRTALERSTAGQHLGSPDGLQSPFRPSSDRVVVAPPSEFMCPLASNLSKAASGPGCLEFKLPGVQGPWWPRAADRFCHPELPAARPP